MRTNAVSKVLFGGPDAVPSEFQKAYSNMSNTDLFVNALQARDISVDTNENGEKRIPGFMWLDKLCNIIHGGPCLTDALIATNDIEHYNETNAN